MAPHNRHRPAFSVHYRVLPCVHKAFSVMNHSHARYKHIRFIIKSIELLQQAVNICRSNVRSDSLSFAPRVYRPQHELIGCDVERDSLISKGITCTINTTCIKGIRSKCDAY
jgi:hypothetical protein